MRTTENLTWHDATLSRDEREAAIGQRGGVVWLTGLSGSGKSTIARFVEQALVRRGVLAGVLDGDNVRLGLNRDLGFSAEDRAENIRRVACVAQLFAEAGVVCLTAFISPFRADRAVARAIAGDRFIEVHVATPMETCETRDPKGLYQKARAGAIAEFTGVSSPWEPPETPEIRLATDGCTVEECAAVVIAALEDRGWIPKVESAS